MMERRTFVVGGVAALAAPLAAEAQQAGKVYRIGYLFEFEMSPPDPTPTPLRAFEETLRELGYVEGRNLAVERRFAAYKYNRLPELAAELVRLKLDVIVTAGNLSIAALKQATTTAPIVMVWAVDPVGAGLVASLARPGTSRARAWISIRSSSPYKITPVWATLLDSQTRFPTPIEKLIRRPS